jgi:hypothetical protein
MRPRLLSTLLLLCVAMPAGAQDSAATASQALQPVPVSPGYARAVQAGTRTGSGRPGPRYWQARVRYDIRAELDPRTAQLTGSERVVWHNASPNPVRTMVLNLYQNLFSRELIGDRPFATDGMTLTRVAAQGTELREQRGVPAWTAILRPQGPAGYAVWRTSARVRLPRALAPGDSVVLEIDWRQRVPPRGGPRTGWDDTLGARAFQVSQWYPQVAAYDDVHDWDPTPYLGTGELYTPFGDFDVALTVPAGHLVGATGELQNAEQVLPGPVLQRLRQALASDSVTEVVTEADLAAGRATLPGDRGKVTWRFRARDVRDFAFGTSGRYVWRASRVRIPAPDGSPRDVAIHALHRPGAPGWDVVPGDLRHTLEFYSGALIPYIYPQMTAVEGPVPGMEHPQLIFIGRVADRDAMRYLVIHEAGHEWFPMMVQQDEAAYAWLDEGLNTYYDELAQRAAVPDSQFHLGSLESYRRIAGSRDERALSTHMDQVSGAAWAVTGYHKPAVLMRALRSVVGDETFERTMRTYARDWLLKHPTPWDFFNAFEREHGRDLDWFWFPWWFTTRTLDYAVAAVEPVPGGVRVTVEDRGEIAAPTRLLVTMEGGATVLAEIPVERWLRGPQRVITGEIPAAGPVVRVEIDPEQFFPDVRPANNVWSATPSP